MPDAKVQVVLANTNGLAADQFINTFHFEVSAYNDIVGNSIALRLSRFYNEVQSTAVAISEYLGNCIDRGSTASMMRMYNEADDSLPPWFETDWDLGPTATTADLPWEVACCASFKNTSVTTTPQRQRRGRVYIGPLNISSYVESGGSIRPSSPFMTTLLDAMQKLFDDNNASATWQVWSKVANNGFPVEAGWVDNAFDTQRRRGETATARQSQVF